MTMSNIIRIFSSNNNFTDVLSDNFSQKGFEAQVISFSGNKAIEESSNLPGYCLFVFDHEILKHFQTSRKTIEEFLSIANKSYKSLFIFPNILDKEYKDTVKKWLVDILGTAESIKGTLFIDTVVDQNGQIVFGASNSSNPNTNTFTELNWIANRIVFLTFSMKAYGQKTALLGSTITANSVFSGLKSNISISEPVMPFYTQIEICPVKVNIKKDSALNFSQTIPINSDLKKPVAEMSVLTNLDAQSDTYSKTKSYTKPVISFLLSSTLIFWQSKVLKYRSKYFSRKYNIKILLLISAGIVVSYLLVPVVLFTIAVKMLVLTNIQYLKINPFLNQKIIATSLTMLNGSQKTAEINTNIALLNNFYQNQQYNSKRLGKVVSVYSDLNKIKIEGLLLLQKIVRGEVSESWGDFQQLSTNLEYLDVNTGFITADVDIQKMVKQYNIRPFTETIELRNTIKEYKNLVNNLPYALGKNSIKKYAVVIQSSEYLRGSGGKVDALGILELAGGKINNFTVYDVDRLKNGVLGEIEAPGTFAKFFKPTEWNITESTWHSDFVLSAKEISWFLEKELDIEVDGVLALNDSVLDDIINITSDYFKIEIDNKVNVRVEGENSVLIEKFVKAFNILSNENSYKYSELMLSGEALLKNKRILTYHREYPMQKALENLGWGSDIKVVDCGEDCVSDVVGEMETSISGGATNIQKQIDLNVVFEEKIIKKRLTLFAKNLNSFDYKTVFRIVANDNSGFSPVTLITEDGKKTMNGIISSENGFKENSVEVVIKSGQSIGVSFYWEQFIDNLTDHKQYALKVIKQPNELDYDLALNIISPKDTNISALPLYSLTDSTTLGYNTKLSSDLIIKIDWMKQ